MTKRPDYVRIPPMTRATTARKKVTKGKGRTTGSIRTFRSALNYLGSAVNYERIHLKAEMASDLNLTRIEKLLRALGDPHKKYKSAHVAGSKGKGSTVTMLAGMLSNTGYRVGLYVSPHVMTLRERISINGEMISESEFTKCLSQVSIAAQKPSIGEPTYFELMTAVAFLYFAEKGVEIAVVETGLGGRFDATNIISPEVVGITNISYDHMPILGNTLEEIASEKAGVFKQGIPVVASPQAESVDKLLRDRAEELQCPFQMTGKENGFSFRFESSPALGPHTRICVTTPTSHFEHVHAPLLGDHQAVNCALALGMLDMLKTRGVAVDDRLAVEGLADIKLIGRMEMVYEDPRILVDGAHNASSVDTLMRAIGQNVPYDSMVIIFGCRKDKDIDGMLKFIRLGADKLIFAPTGSARSADPIDLAARFNEVSTKMCQVADSLEEALSIAERAVTRDDLICITGSFHLVGKAKRWAAAANEARDAEAIKNVVVA